MLKQNRNRTVLLESIILIVFFFLFINSFSSNYQKYHNKSHHYEIVTEIKSNNIALNDFQEFTNLNCPKSLIDILNINFFNKQLKINTDNCNSNIKIAINKNLVLKKPPIFLLKYIHLYMYSGKDDIPNLS